MTEESNKRTILIIDDDITSLDIVAFLFEKRGYNVVRCSSGSSGIESVKESNPDIMLVDLLMPGLNGVETVREIRSLGFEEVPIIAFTALNDPDFHEQAEQAGCDRVLTKPYPAKKLLVVIEEFLGSK